MQKLNALGVEILSLKTEMMKTDYPEIVKRALRETAENMVKKEAIDVELHLALTDEKLSTKEFEEILLENPSCLKTKEELFVEYEQIRESLQEELNKDEALENITSSSMVDEEQLSFSKTFKLDNQWVSEYFGQPANEVDKLMVRNGFVEKFAVLRLSKILEDFLKSDDFLKHDDVICKATRVFYDVENHYYGIHLVFYIDIEVAEDKEKIIEGLEYIRNINEKATNYMNDRMKV